MKTPDLLVITSFPTKGTTHGVGTVGVASYAKNTLKSLLSAAKRRRHYPRIVVLAEKLPGISTRYADGGLSIRRVWKRGSPFVYLSMLREVLHFRGTQKVLIEFELAMLGGPIVTAFFPIFTWALRLLGKEITLVSHQVVDDLSTLAGHIGIEKKSFKTKLLTAALSLFYRLSLAPVQRIIVFENHLKLKLAPFVGRDKIEVIPLGVEIFRKKLSKRQARKTLALRREFVILCFGFIAWYKGTDWVVRQVQRLAKDKKFSKVKLIIAGGPNPNHEGKKHYSDYVKAVQAVASESGGKIEVTGFIHEGDIPAYFSACDLVIFPYRAFMSSSAPLSLALSFKKPFLLSDTIKGVWKNDDAKKIMLQLRVSQKRVTFKLRALEFEQKLYGIMKNRAFRAKLAVLSSKLRDARNFALVADHYYRQLF